MYVVQIVKFYRAKIQISSYIKCCNNKNDDRAWTLQYQKWFCSEQRKSVEPFSASHQFEVSFSRVI